MRVELRHKNILGNDDIVTLCDDAVAGNVDAVFVPPIHVNDAFAMLKQYKTTIVTSAASANDVLDTKIMAIDKANQGGAKEIIIELSPHDLHDGNWKTIEKEVFQLSATTQMYDMQPWIECSFPLMLKEDQAKLASMLPEGCGLRMFRPEKGDVQMARLCSVQHVCFGIPIDRVDWEMLGEFEKEGATQVSSYIVPPKIKTDTLFVNGEEQ